MAIIVGCQWRHASVVGLGTGHSARFVPQSPLPLGPVVQATTVDGGGWLGRAIGV